MSSATILEIDHDDPLVHDQPPRRGQRYYVSCSPGTPNYSVIAKCAKCDWLFDVAYSDGLPIAESNALFDTLHDAASRHADEAHQ